MSRPDRCPFATWTPSPNFTPGNAGRTAVVLHISEGLRASALPWLRNPASAVSSHFFVTRGGAICQLVNLGDTAWTNGLTPHGDGFLTPHGAPVTPRWSLLERGVNPNRQTITIEHEGFHGQPWPAAQEAASVRLLAWLHQVLDLVYEPLWTLIGHCHINPVDKAACPGSAVDYGRLAARALNQRCYRVAVPAGAILRAQASVESARIDALEPRTQVVGIQVPSAVTGERGPWVRSRRGYVRRDLLEVAS